jgi:hypothetical protein
MHTSFTILSSKIQYTTSKMDTMNKPLTETKFAPLQTMEEGAAATRYHAPFPIAQLTQTRNRDKRAYMHAPCLSTQSTQTQRLDTRASRHMRPVQLERLGAYRHRRHRRRASA